MNKKDWNARFAASGPPPRSLPKGLLTALAIPFAIAGAVWALLIYSTTFQDSEGRDRHPSILHVLWATFLALTPFTVPAVLIYVD